MRVADSVIFITVIVTKHCGLVLKALSLVPCGAKSRILRYFPPSAIVTKHCSIVLKVLSLVQLFGSKLHYYSSKVLCHYDHCKPYNEGINATRKVLRAQQLAYYLSESSQ